MRLWGRGADVRQPAPPSEISCLWGSVPGEGVTIRRRIVNEIEP